MEKMNKICQIWKTTKSKLSDFYDELVDSQENRRLFHNVILF